MLNLFGVQIGALLGGVLIVEFIFNYPGFGLLTVQAVLQRKGGFDPTKQLDFLSRHEVSNVFATPTAIRSPSSGSRLN